MTINATKTVRDVVVEIPGATRLFEKLGIDYCCGGGKPLAEACASVGISEKEFSRLLEAAANCYADKEGFKDWEAETLASLTEYIVSKHHVFTREELDRVEPLLAKVRSVHGERHPELLSIQKLFTALKAELFPHMSKEEQVLFPYVRSLEEAVASREPAPLPFFGTVRNPVRMMMMEHDAAGEILRNMRELSDDYAVPADACISFQTLYQALEGLEADLHQHIHLENNILFPRAVELEGAAR
ncbi:MAG TPA: iron-sulfur cluster repair di-iron protein [Blastocatellia bacterium]|nr:iron-sulfur cluster repair di-iron protein [Blastocatellia bacterium]